MTLDAAANVFKLQFAAYQAILTGDYLQHSVLYNALDSELLQLPVLRTKAQVSLLDLGCGDVSASAMTYCRCCKGGKF